MDSKEFLEIKDRHNHVDPRQVDHTVAMEGTEDELHTFVCGPEEFEWMLVAHEDEGRLIGEVERLRSNYALAIMESQRIFDSYIRVMPKDVGDEFRLFHQKLAGLS